MARVKTDRACDAAELVSAYLDGELRIGELDVVVTHLVDCAECIREFHQLKEIRAAVRTLPRLELPDRLLPDGHMGEQLSAYLDGELRTTEHAFVTVHLDDCTECRLDLHELDAARTAVRSLPGLEPPEFLAMQRHRLERERWSRRRVVTAAIGIAAAAALVVGTLSSTRVPTTDVNLHDFFDQHQARLSVDTGIGFLPAFAPQDGGP